MTMNEISSVFHIGDCRNVLKLYDKQFQLAFFSTPYPQQRGFEVSSSDYISDWLPSILESLLPTMKETAVIVQNVMFKSKEYDGWKMSLPDTLIFQIPSIYEKFGLRLINPYIWDKLNAPPSGNLKLFDHNGYEYCFAFALTDKFKFNPQRKPYSDKWVKKSKSKRPRQSDISGSLTGGHTELNPLGARQDNVLRMSSSGDKRRARAKGGSFPIKLAERILLTFSDEGDCVVDPFCGTGTFNKVAKNNNRPSVGIDINPNEIEKAIEWLGLRLS